MKIRDVRTAVLDVKWGPWHREWTIVRIDTDSEISGYGEAAGPSGVLKAHISSYRDLLVGQDPAEVERLLREMTARAFAGFNASHFESSMRIHAAGAMETALWDISGKALGVPVYRLLGGKHRDKVRLYACVGGLETYLSMKEVYEKLGISILKFDVSPASLVNMPGCTVDTHLTKKGLHHLVKKLDSIVSEVGGDAEIAVEGRCGTLANAVRFMNAVESFDLAWVEDLLPPTNIDAWKIASDAGSTPTLTGEGLHTRHEFLPYFQRQAMRVAAPDFQVCGGLSEGKKIAEMADLHYMSAAPHNASSAVGIAAAVHTCAAIPNLLALEFHAMPEWDRICKDSCLKIQDGFIEIPQGPGLGIELDEEMLEKYSKDVDGVFHPV